MNYKLTQGWPFRISDNVFVNPTGQEYSDWVSKGGVPVVADPIPTPTPAVVDLTALAADVQMLKNKMTAVEGKTSKLP